MDVISEGPRRLEPVLELGGGGGEFVDLDTAGEGEAVPCRVDAAGEIRIAEVVGEAEELALGGGVFQAGGAEMPEVGHGGLDGLAPKKSGGAGPETGGLGIVDVDEVAGRRIPPGAGAHVRCQGKGRKNRCTPLTGQIAAVLRVWLAERGGGSADALFPNHRGSRLSRDAVEGLLAKYTTVARWPCLTLRSKHISPHVLRHTSAMQLLEAGVDTSVIALWLGHASPKTTQIYLHADMAIKERALARTAPPSTRPGRYRPRDPLLAFLEAL